ncbi:MAG TPA: protein-glutamate O-methyltransferase [Nitrospirota bacterium]|nr:protein-glutamate O-methyltransferase [Nitrospirota bacterium]
MNGTRMTTTDTSSKIASGTQSLSDDDLHSLSRFIHGECGIKMPLSKRVMLESRLQKRLRALGIKTFKDYCVYLFSEEGKSGELTHCIDAITTNKTDFFREANHFDYLTSQALPALIESPESRCKKQFTVWSAGCSTGEEPYTLAMVLNEFAEIMPGFDFKVLATDISTQVLDKAKLGVYAQESVSPVPEELKMKYLLRSKDRRKGLVRIVPRLREKVVFQRLNFMESHFNIREKVDVIFCRNVIIYFDRSTQETLMNKFCRYLMPRGYLFLGHSETLHSMDVPLVSVAPTIYRMPK